MHLAWHEYGWRLVGNIVLAHFKTDTIEIPIGRALPGSFYLKRLGEAEWQVAPLRCGKLRPESFDIDGHYYGFLHLVGSPSDVNDAMEHL